MDSEFDRIEAQRHKDKSEQDRKDYYNEMEGNDVGRISRFGGVGHVRKKEQKEEQKKRSNFNILMQTVAYREAFTAAMQALNTADEAVYNALNVANENLTAAQKDHQNLLDTAATLPNGDRFFRDRNGDFYTQNGEQLMLEDVHTIEWKSGHPTWEAYQASQEKLRLAEARYDQIQDHENTLADIREELEDENNPASLARVVEINAEISQIQAYISPQPDHTADIEVQRVNPSAVPNLGL